MNKKEMTNEDECILNINIKRLREFKQLVNTFTKTRELNDLTEVATKLADIYSDVFGFDCVLKVSRRQ